MLKSLCFSLTLLLPSISLAQSLIAVNKKMFTVGNYWVWEYKTIEGDHNSYEKYLVLSQQGSKVTFEMQSQLSGESAFKAHHRFSVDIAKCKAAYTNYHRLKTWKLESFSYRNSNGRWVDAGFRDNTQVFEEKFNCHTFIDVNQVQFKHKIENAYLASLGDVVFSVNKRVYARRGQSPSKYIFQPYDMAAVAGYKLFNEGVKGQEYTFELVDWNLN